MDALKTLWERHMDAVGMLWGRYVHAITGKYLGIFRSDPTARWQVFKTLWYHCLVWQGLKIIN